MSLGKLDAICARLKSFQQPQGKGAANLTTNGDSVSPPASQDSLVAKPNPFLLNESKASPLVVLAGQENGRVCQEKSASSSERRDVITNGSSCAEPEGSLLEGPKSLERPKSLEGHKSLEGPSFPHRNVPTNSSSCLDRADSSLDRPKLSQSPTNVSSSNNNNSKTTDFNTRVANGATSDLDSPLVHSSAPLEALGTEHSEAPGSSLKSMQPILEKGPDGNSRSLSDSSGKPALLAGDVCQEGSSLCAETSPTLCTNENPSQSIIAPAPTDNKSEISHPPSSFQNQTTNDNQLIETSKSNTDISSSSLTAHSIISSLHTQGKEKLINDNDSRLKGDNFLDLKYMSPQSSPPVTDNASIDHQSCSTTEVGNLCSSVGDLQKMLVDGSCSKSEKCSTFENEQSVNDRNCLVSGSKCSEYKIHSPTKNYQCKNKNIAQGEGASSSSNRIIEGTPSKEWGMQNGFETIPENSTHDLSAVDDGDNIEATKTTQKDSTSSEINSTISETKGISSESPENGGQQDQTPKDTKKENSEPDPNLTNDIDMGTGNTATPPDTSSSFDNFNAPKLQHIPDSIAQRAAPILAKPCVGASTSSSTNTATETDSMMCNNNVKTEMLDQPTPLSEPVPSPSKPTVPLAGRKKSRKAAKPKKQPHFSQSVMEPELSDSDPPIEAHRLSAMNDPVEGQSLPATAQSQNRMAHNDIPSASRQGTTSTSLTSTPPLDLTSLHDKDLRVGSEQTPGSSSESANQDSQESMTTSQGSKDRTDTTKEDKQDQAGSENTKPSDGNESSTSTECKGLVDFAHNTMQELLGIYGLEESPESGHPRLHINISPSALQHPPSGAADQGVQQNDTSVSARKSRPFRKNVYTSLAHHAVDSTSASPLALNPVPESLSTKRFQLIHSNNNSNENTPAVSPTTSLAVGSVATAAASQGPKKIYPQKPPNYNDVSKYIRRYHHVDTDSTECHIKALVIPSAAPSDAKKLPDYNVWVELSKITAHITDGYCSCPAGYMSSEDCGNSVCHELGYKDHYHCLDCHLKVFVRKEEMLRHYKWHKKRQDSLQHGFMRYSPDDDCSVKYRGCAHNGRQTHYHCVQHNCDKVYVSTSDVQMHANFHRKDSAIIQEGFQRFRATEDCGTPSCAFYGHRTTHFHCRRPHCNFTFKNKADMEKHKSYHQKDEVLSKDGFKKFMKYEPCPFPGCRFSRVSNHIHCIRAGCQYVLHSTAQLYSHKRKHERREFESAYRNYRQLQQERVQIVTQEPSSTSSVHSSQQTTRLQFPIGTLNVGHSTETAGQGKSKKHLNGGLGLPTKGPGQAEPEFLALDLSETSQASHLSSAGPSTPEPASMIEPMALPVQVLTPQAIKEDPEGSVESETLEPEDLSLPHRKRKLSLDAREEEEGPALHVKVIKQEPMADKKLLISGGSFEGEGDTKLSLAEMYGGGSISQENEIDEEDEDDDEDDDDDDDKDYGQVEEPTLINTCFSSAEDEEDNEADDSNTATSQILPETVPAPGEDFSIKQETSLVENGPVEEKNDVAALNMKLQKQLLEAAHRPHSLCIPQLLDLKPTKAALGLSKTPVFMGQRKGPGRPRKHPVETSGAVKKEVGSGLSGKLGSSSLAQKQCIVGESGGAGMMGVAKQRSSLDVNELVLKSAVLSTDQAPQALLNPEGRVWGLHVPIKLADKRERDENWKKYLIRYTANDACFSRCACLYKDHYHCRIEGCKVTFKSKDGVRGHARFHELQDSIGPIVFRTVSGKQTCPVAGCHYSRQEDHYHCNWVDCNQVIPSSGPTFARLEHYRIHEFTMPAANRGTKPPSTVPANARGHVDPFQKRRGRPPKYVKHQVVPKVYLTEQEITESTLAYHQLKPYKNDSILNGFKRFHGHEELCPDQRCIFRGKLHYHCGRKQCHMATDRLDVLNLHAKDFHNNVTILEGFEFFERVVDCRRPSCHNNRTNRHYHCMRPRCDYSFVRHSTMVQHNKKHPTVTSAVLSAPLIPTQGRSLGPGSRGTSSLSTGVTKSFSTGSYVPIAPAVTSSITSLQLSQPSIVKTSIPLTVGVSTSPTSGKTVKSAGTFFPLSGLSSMAVGQAGNQVSSAQLSNPEGAAQNLASDSIGQVGSGQIIPGAQIIQTAGNTQVLSTAGGMCLAIPQNLGSNSLTSLPLLAAQGSQPSVFTSLIPLSQLSPLVSLPGGQLLTTSQGQILQPTGTNVVHVLQSPPPPPAAVQTQQATLPQPEANSSGTAMAPLAMLLQHHQQLQQKGLSPPLSWAVLRERMRFSVERNCGRPFCKLKKRDHYHCLDCNQAFSDPTRLRSHIGKHGFKFKKSDRSKKSSSMFEESEPIAVDLSVQETFVKKDRKTNLSEEDEEEEELSSSLNLQPSVFTSMVSTAEPLKTPVHPTISSGVELSSSGQARNHSLQGQSSSSLKNMSAEDLSSSVISSSSDSRQGELPGSPSLVIDDSCDESYESSLNASSSSLTLCSSLTGRKSGRKRLATQSKDFISSDSMEIPKPTKIRKTAPGSRSHSDVPEGYLRVRCGEDCGYIRCAYRQTVTHFHCLRADCGYGFSDKSRILQHTMRHERLDLLMGDDFQQFRASVSCQRADCEYDEKASHFHCLKCPFSSADSSKVPAHRKFHARLDNISSNGFIKFSGTADCQIASCAYFRKQTHYHCTFQGCSHAVLGPSQMAPHKLKHAQHQRVH